jgi:catechol 2,3-dioxygenase
MSTIENPNTETTTVATLPDALRLGPAHLTVSDLDGSIAFYERSLGLQLHGRGGDTATLGAGTEDLVVLHGRPGADGGGRHAGLYHFALLFPTREELARAVHRLAVTRTRIDGAADHGVSEAIYLRDPDDNGIELYADRPREEWQPGRQPADRYDIVSIALDMRSLLDTVAGEEISERAGSGLVMGHLHLHVGDIERGLAFYRDVLGFEVMANLGSAAFVSAGSYHHHLGFNVWQGHDVKPRPENAAGLDRWVVVLPSATDVEAVAARVRAEGLALEEREGGFVVRDPWGTAVAISTTPNA